MAKKRLSVICPVHNEEACVEIFHRRVVAALAPLGDRYDWELVFMNNRSTDATAELVRGIRDRDPNVHLLTLSRNCGYQASIATGLRYVDGDATVIIDVDCEDPPEMIPRFVEAWERGSDVVYGERKNRPEPRLLIAARRTFYRLMRFVADSDITLDMAEFSLFDRAVREALLTPRDTFPFLRSELAHVGFQRTAIPYDRQPRAAGVTHYNVWSMTRFAVAGILSSSTLPLRMPLYTLPAVLLVNVGTWIAAVFGGWEGAVPTLLAVDLTWLCTAVSFLALYIARDYRNSIARPVGIIDWARSAADRRVPHAVPPGAPLR
ncbi:MAG: glycosyltransferase family 2 protein [Myxococcota bacterium]